MKNAKINKAEDKKILSDHFTIQIGDEKREIFMSYGLLSMLASFVGNLDNLVRLGVDPLTHNTVATVLLAPKDSKGRPQLEKTTDGKVIEFDIFEVNVSVAQVQALVSWAGEHLLDFFMKGMQNLMDTTEGQKALLTKMTQQMKVLEQSTSGIVDSLSKMPVAGQ